MTYCEECRSKIESSERPEEFDSNYQKGRRNELEAIKILDSCFNATEAKSNTLGHDFLGIADIIAVSDSDPFKLVQVKTNGLPSRMKRHRYAKKASMHLPIGTHADFEIWVRNDYEGWELYRLKYSDVGHVTEAIADDESVFERFASISICKESRARAAYKFGVRSDKGFSGDIPDVWEYNEDDFELYE